MLHFGSKPPCQPLGHCERTLRMPLLPFSTPMLCMAVESLHLHGQLQGRLLKQDLARLVWNGSPHHSAALSCFSKSLATSLVLSHRISLFPCSVSQIPSSKVDGSQSVGNLTFPGAADKPLELMLDTDSLFLNYLELGLLAFCPVELTAYNLIQRVHSRFKLLHTPTPPSLKELNKHYLNFL